MIYVMTDIHGCYQAFLQMLDLIQLTDEDDLYILGDFVDRGPEPIPLLLDCMERVNVYPLLGNHEAFMMACLSGLPNEATFENITDYYTIEGLEIFAAWLENGGAITAEQYLALSPKRRQDLMEYLKDFSVYEDITLQNGKRYLMTHSGIEHFSPEKAMSDYTIDELINARPQQSDRFFDDRMLLFGHTPTFTYPQMHGKTDVLFTDTYINLDCGAVFSEVGGKLACLRLDDERVFYI